MWQVYLETEDTGRTGDMKYVASARLKRDAIRKAGVIKRKNPDKEVLVQRTDAAGSTVVESAFVVELDS